MKSPIGAVPTAPAKQPALLTTYPVQPPTATATRSDAAASPAPTARIETAEVVATVPDVGQTLQASVPAQQQEHRPAQTSQQPMCPSGTVISGLSYVTVTGEREWMVGTLLDLVGHGVISNGTTAPVNIPLYLPYIPGLDATGRLTMNSFSGDFDYTPPPGQPRHATISLAPGQSITYTFVAKEVTSKTVSATVAWYSNPEFSVSGFSDIPSTMFCPGPAVSSPPGGASIMNTYVPQGQ